MKNTIMKSVSADAKCLSVACLIYLNLKDGDSSPCMEYRLKRGKYV